MSDALLNHIKAINAKTREWVEAEEGRWAGYLVEDMAHWAESDIYTVEDFERNRLVMDIWESYRDAYGHRPRHINFDEYTFEELEAMADRLAEAATAAFEERQAEERQNEAEIESKIAEFVGMGASDRETAIRWLLDSLDLSDQDMMYGSGYVAYTLNIGYHCNLAKEIDTVIDKMAA